LDGGALEFLKIDADLPKDINVAFMARAVSMPLARLGAGSWQFEDGHLARLRDKILIDKKSLSEVYGAPLYGIKTGLNEAFIVDKETRDGLVKRHGASAKLLKPFLRGENIQRWRVESEGLFLINIPRGKIDIEEYPALRDWLSPFKGDLKKRATKQEWFELQQAQLAYQPKFDGAKIVYPIISQGPKFARDLAHSYINDKSFMLPLHGELLALLNSRLVWFILFGTSSALRGGQWRLELREQYISILPIPDMSTKVKGNLGKLANSVCDAAESRLVLQEAGCHRIIDLASTGYAKLSRKLREWWTLDFSAFRDEVKRVFKTEIPVKERGEWEAYLEKQGSEVKALDAEIEAAEREIDAIVYRLFDLTPEEIALLEASIAGQH
jgi:hypothetical protein